MGKFATIGDIENATKRNDENASVFTVRVPPWHGCGEVLDHNPTVEEALRKMHGNYFVDKVPATYDGLEVPGHFWTVRTDTNLVLGHVGNDFTVIQQQVAFDILEVIGGNVQLETGGVLGKGERIFISCKLPQTTKIGGDLIEHYFVILNSHDGSSSVLLLVTPIRPVCQNTVNLALQGAVRRASIRHTANYQNKLKEAARVLGILSNYYTTFDDICKGLLKQKFSEKAFGEMVDVLLKKPGDDASSRRVLSFETQRNLMFTAYNVPDLANLDNTAWKAYNAIADYADHARHSRGEDEAKKAANRFLRTFIETDLKDAAYDYLVKAR